MTNAKDQFYRIFITFNFDVLKDTLKNNMYL